MAINIFLTLNVDHQNLIGSSLSRSGCFCQNLRNIPSITTELLFIATCRRPINMMHPAMAIVSMETSKITYLTVLSQTRDAQD